MSFASLFIALHSKSSFKYTSFVLSEVPIFHKVSILEESSKNLRILSQVRVLSEDIMRSTDSLNHFAISIL
jgi:hypothetical protein